jgi:hypothetical protein
MTTQHMHPNLPSQTQRVEVQVDTGVQVQVETGGKVTSTVADPAPIYKVL